ncbi:MAG: AAA family ATPase [bacterium]|nr:AAA family ATPase [bacterium]
MKTISKVVIENFRSIKRIEISPKDINVFSGLNDTGKSNVLKALNLFFNNETDFQTPLKFSQDFSKVALASAQRARKQKQQIKIKIYFQPPVSFPSLKKESGIFLEKVFNRDGTVGLNYSINDSKKQAQITRLVNKINYFYIPALKGADVLRFLLGKIGEHQLISPEEISKLNEEVNKNLSDLKDILNLSDIKITTSMGFPVLVRDFWERLTVNTQYDQFSQLQGKTTEKSDHLKVEFYQIPLELRGEGIKSKYIPPLLKWIQQKRNTSIYIWGIDEPENSLEFRKAQEVADLYFSQYAKDTQIFLTTHSFAFIFAEPKDKIASATFRCIQGNLGQTEIKSLEDLFIEQSRIELAEEVGALEIQKEVYKDWKEKDALLQLREETIRGLSEARKPALLVEGDSDKKIIEIAWKKLFGSKAPFTIESGGSSNYLKNFVKNPALKIANRDKVIALWDCDCRGFGDFQDLRNKNGFNEISATEVKHNNSNIWGLLLPTPASRENYTDIASNNAQLQFLEIEHYFDDPILQAKGIIEQTLQNGVNTLKENRSALLSSLNSLQKNDFINFEPLFIKLKSLYGIT